MTWPNDSAFTLRYILEQAEHAEEMAARHPDNSEEFDWWQTQANTWRTDLPPQQTPVDFQVGYTAYIEIEP